jgi:hypothetical protein
MALRAISAEPIMLPPAGDPAFDDRASWVWHIESKDPPLAEIAEKLGAVWICALINHKYSHG